MFTLAKRYGTDILKQLDTPLDEIKEIYPHAASKRLAMDIEAEVGTHNKFRHIYPEYGNLVSASIPASIAMAREEHAIDEGDILGSLVGSAGMSFCSFAFRL